MAPAQAMDLWISHVLGPERLTRYANRTLVFPPALFEDWHGVLRRIAEDLQISLRLDDPDALNRASIFVSDELRHYRTPRLSGVGRAQLKLARDSYRILEQGTREALDEPALDRLYRQWKHLQATATPVRHYLEARLLQVEQRLAEVTTENGGYVHRIQEVENQREALVAEVRGLGEALEARAQELEGVRAELSASRAEVQGLGTEREAVAAEAGALRVEVESFRRQVERTDEQLSVALHELEGSKQFATKLEVERDREHEAAGILNKRLEESQALLTEQAREAVSEREHLLGKLQEAQVSLVRFQAQKAGLEAELGCVYISRSWRVTRPLRSLMVFLRSMGAWVSVWTIGRSPHLRPRGGAEALGANRWRSTDQDPNFVLENVPRVACGWVHFRAVFTDDTGASPPARLYFDCGSGFAEAMSLPLRGFKRGKIRQVVYVPPNAVVIRLDPVDRQQTFTLSNVRFRKGLWLSLRKGLASRLHRWELKHLGAVNAPGNARPGYRIAKVIRHVLPGTTHGAFGRFFRRLLLAPRGNAVGRMDRDYPTWIEHHDRLQTHDIAAINRQIQALPHRVKISIIMPVCDVSLKVFRATIGSVRAQLYPDWELCIADDASRSRRLRRYLKQLQSQDERIRVIFREQRGHISAASNSALGLAEGEWIVLLDHDDFLAPDALHQIACTVIKHPRAEIIYSDEDKIDNRGRRFDPYFKGDFSPDLMFCQNQISHLGAYRTDRVREIGGFREGLEGSQDWDLALRVLEHCGPKRVIHIPKVLYHWRVSARSTASTVAAKPYVLDAGRRAVQDYLDRTCSGATVEPVPGIPFQRVHYPLRSSPPLASILIPSRDAPEVLRACVDSILERTEYGRYEILVMDNGSEDEESIAYLRYLNKNSLVRVLCLPGPFNFSRLNNTAVRAARGEVVVLLNNDTEVISRDWLRELVSQAVRPEVGAVGARLLYPDGTVQHAGVVTGVGGVANHVPSRLARDEPGYFSHALLTRDVSAVTGACLAIRRRLYGKMAGLDEKNLAVAFNDIDLCLRLREQGYRVIYAPAAELYHHESKSRGADLAPEKIERFEREVEYMKRRWGGRLERDPFYNPNRSLTFDCEGMQLAVSPRTRVAWQDFLQPTTAETEGNEKFGSSPVEKNNTSHFSKTAGG